MGRFVDITGKTFNRLTVISRAGYDGVNPTWHCLCVCGRRTISRGSKLKNGETQSCGCLCKERQRAAVTTHGKAGSSEYKIWDGARYRCVNPKATYYANYGGRGITMHAEWMESFAAFFRDMGPRPSKRHTLDRIDNDGPYSPANCRWATRKQQSNNRGCNRLLEHEGQILTVTEWAERQGLSESCLRRRLFIERLSIHDALNRPLIPVRDRWKLRVSRHSAPR